MEFPAHRSRSIHVVQKRFSLIDVIFGISTSPSLIHVHAHFQPMTKSFRRWCRSRNMLRVADFSCIIQYLGGCQARLVYQILAKPERVSRYIQGLINCCNPSTSTVVDSYIDGICSRSFPITSSRLFRSANCFVCCFTFLNVPVRDGILTYIVQKQNGGQ